MYLNKNHFILVFIVMQNICVKYSVTTCNSGVQYIVIIMLCPRKACVIVTFSANVKFYETGKIRMWGTLHILWLMTLRLIS